VHRQTRSVLKAIEKVEDLVEVQAVEADQSVARIVSKLETPHPERVADMSETPYETSHGDALYIEMQGRGANGAYLAAEDHKTFYSVAWPTPLGLSDSVEEFLRSKPSSGPHARRNAQALYINDRGVQKCGLQEAIARARVGADAVQLLRLEFPSYTFVWRRLTLDGGEALGEIGLMCSRRDDRFLADMMRRTAASALVPQVDSLVAKASKVVAGGVESA
jgi:hypothetical protein